MKAEHHLKFTLKGFENFSHAVVCYMGTALNCFERNLHVCSSLSTSEDRICHLQGMEMTHGKLISFRIVPEWSKASQSSWQACTTKLCQSALCFRNQFFEIWSVPWADCKKGWFLKREWAHGISFLSDQFTLLTECTTVVGQPVFCSRNKCS